MSAAAVTLALTGLAVKLNKSVSVYVPKRKLFHIERTYYEQVYPDECDRFARYLRKLVISNITAQAHLKAARIKPRVVYQLP